MGSPTQRVIKLARKRGVNIVTRKRWFSIHQWHYQWRRRHKPHALCPSHKVDTIVQHITVTKDGGNKPRHFRRDMRTVERIGWQSYRSGVSYNWVIDMETGMVGLGQSLDAKGTHTINRKNIPNFTKDQNAVAFAIAFLGMPGQVPTRKAVSAWVNLIAAHIDSGYVTEHFDFMPHAEFTWKSCPTPEVIALMEAAKKRALKLAKRS